MRFYLTLLAVLTLAQPAFAQDAPKPDDAQTKDAATPEESAKEGDTSAEAEAETPAHTTTDIMDPFQETRHPYMGKVLESDQKYKDRWYDHVNERYGLTLQKPETQSGGKTAAPETGEKIDAAKALMEEYLTLVKAKDPAFTKFYAKDADIEITILHQSGAYQTMNVDVRNHQQVMIKQFSKEQKRGDIVSFSDLTYKTESKGVRVTGEISYTNPKYKSPWSLLIEQDKDGKWLITQESFESIAGKARM